MISQMVRVIYTDLEVEWLLTEISGPCHYLTLKVSQIFNGTAVRHGASRGISATTEFLVTTCLSDDVVFDDRDTYVNNLITELCYVGGDWDGWLTVEPALQLVGLYA